MMKPFRNAPPARQLMIIGGLGFLICAALAALYLLFLRPGYAVLYRDLREADAATIVAELERGHADYRLADGGRTILVPEGRVDETRLHVASQDLPLQGTVGFELFNNSSIGLTEFAQRINLQRALQGELQRTIMTIEGVEAARVHLALGEQTAFRGDRRPPRASVTVRTLSGRSLPPTMVRGIQRLVAGSVPDMEAANVAVLNERGALVSADAPEAAAAGSAQGEQQRIESFFEARIRRALEPLLPDAPLEIDVWAGLGESLGAAAPVPLAGDAAPDSRSYRLRATIAAGASLPAARRAEAARAAEQAIGFDPGLGDSVTLTASAPASLAPSIAPDAVEPAYRAERETRASSPGASWFGDLWVIFLVLLLLGGALVFVRRRGGGRMKEEERLEAIANLRALLAERTADAPRRA